MAAKLGMGLTIGSSPADSASTSVSAKPSCRDALTKNELWPIAAAISQSLGSTRTEIGAAVTGGGDPLVDADSRLSRSWPMRWRRAFGIVTEGVESVDEQVYALVAGEAAEMHEFGHELARRQGREFVELDPVVDAQQAPRCLSYGRYSVVLSRRRRGRTGVERGGQPCESMRVRTDW